MRRQKWRAAAAAAAISVIGTGIGTGGLAGGKQWMPQQMAHAEETETAETETAVTETAETETTVTETAETEPETEAQTETETEAESETETEAETETEESETEELETGAVEAETEIEETETEAGEAETETGESETETWTETDPETEPESAAEMTEAPQTENETASEIEAAETEKASETEAATETELQTETGTVPETEALFETESQSETDTEMETSVETERVITVSSVRIRPGWEEREYDGTDRVELEYDVYVNGEKASPEEAGITCRARLSSPDAGVRDVDCSFSFSPDACEAGPAVLRTENVSLQASIIPRVLTLHIPDAVKEYGAEVSVGNLLFSGEMYAEGFAVDSEGRDIIPEDLVLPDIRVDTGKISRFSPMYADGEACVYEHALIFSQEECSSPNYRFASAAQGGNITVCSGRITEGKDYKLREAQEGVYRDDNGTVWVRRGGTLTIDPVEGSGYNRQVSAENLTESGVFRFSLTAGGSGEVTAVSEESEIPYEVDGDVPFARICTEEMKEQNGILYGSANASVSIEIPEDTGSGIKSAVYGIRFFQSGNEAAGGDETDCMDGCRISGLSDGEYQLYVRVRDQTGNESLAECMPITIDTAAPVIEIEGAGDRNAGDGPSGIRILCRDKNISEKEVGIVLEYKGTGSGNVLKEIRRSSTEEGTEILYAAEDGKGAEDGFYILKVTAEDRAGNKSQREAAFTVNRKGSIYALSQETQSLLETYYHRDSFDLVFEERNISQVKNVRIVCSRGDSARTLEEGRDYIVEETAGRDGMHVFTYRIKRSVFSEDGAYEVILMTSDQTGNSSDTTAQNKEIRFAVDRTAPECLITGISPGSVYMTGELWVSLEPMDNAALSGMEVYVNGKLMGIADEKDITDRNGLIRFKLEEAPSWQDVQIRTMDKAGNESWSEVIPVFIGKRDGGPVPSRKSIPEEKAAGTAPAEDMMTVRTAEKGESEPAVLAGYTLSQEVPAAELPERKRASVPLLAAVMAGLSTVFCVLQKKIGAM